MEYGTGGLWHMIGRWITAVCNTGAGRRVTAGGSRQRYAGGRRITEGTGRASTAGKARRQQAGGLRGTDAEETDYGRGRRQVQVDYG